MRKLVLITAVVALLAPTAFAITCPAKGGSEWREYKTAHFLLDSDMSRFKVESLVKDLETLHGMVLRGLYGDGVDIPGRTRVVAPESPGDFKTLAGSSTIGAYFKADWKGAALIVLPVVGNQASREIVAHELAHTLSRFQFPEQPAWFSEGLAGFFETVARREEQRQDSQFSHIVRGGSTMGGGVGLMPLNFMAAFSGNAGHVPARELFEWGGGESVGDPGRFHLSSWLLYHWLWNQRGTKFGDYQKRLADGEDPAGAWKAAFPEYDAADPAALSALDVELARYGKSARYAFYKVTSTPDIKFTDAPLSSADVHLVLLQARIGWPDSREALIRAELDEALAEDPQNTEALVERARLDGKESPIEKLRASADTRKGDYRAWLALAGSTRNDDERRLAYQKAADLNPESARAQEGVARALTAEGRAREALAFANRALDLEPWNPNMVEALALAAHRLGKCAEAVKLERRAVRMWSGSDHAPADVAGRVAAIESGCKPAAK
jgi:tetratricopeptide (TPR) repeat protein